MASVSNIKWDSGTGKPFIYDNDDVPLVTAGVNPVTGGSVKTIWSGTQAQYEAIAVKDDSTLYLIVSA